MTALSPNCISSRLRSLLRIACQCGSFVFALFFTSAFVLGADTAGHSFTDQQGRTSLPAQIVRVAAPDVYLQSGNGQPYPVKISALSAKDQAYIQQWASDHQKAAEHFAISAVRDVVTDSASDVPQRGFDVTLKNLADKDVVNLRVDYVVLRQPNTDSAAPLPRISGTSKIPLLAKGKDASFETDRIAAKGTHIAVWVRVYDSRGVLLQEWSSAPELTKNEDWNSDGTSGKTVGSHGSERAPVTADNHSAGMGLGGGHGTTR